MWYNPADAFRRIVDITWIEAEFSFAMKILNKINKYGYIQVIYNKIYISDGVLSLPIDKL